MRDQRNMTERGAIRAANAQDGPAILAVVNAAAVAYRGVIPEDRWHEPYMAAEELACELRDGVNFYCYVEQDGITGVMGRQRRGEVDLIRHAYVVPRRQGHGIGAALVGKLCNDRKQPILVGTWRAAEWAIRFYERQGFGKVPSDAIAPLLTTYWTVPERQIETSVVLSLPHLGCAEIAPLIAGEHPAKDRDGWKAPPPQQAPWPISIT